MLARNTVRGGRSVRNVLLSVPLPLPWHPGLRSTRNYYCGAGSVHTISLVLPTQVRRLARAGRGVAFLRCPAVAPTPLPRCVRACRGQAPIARIGGSERRGAVWSPCTWLGSLSLCSCTLASSTIRDGMCLCFPIAIHPRTKCRDGVTQRRDGVLTLPPPCAAGPRTPTQLSGPRRRPHGAQPGRRARPLFILKPLVPRAATLSPSSPPPPPGSVSSACACRSFIPTLSSPLLLSRSCPYLSLSCISFCFSSKFCESRLTYSTGDRFCVCVCCAIHSSLCPILEDFVHTSREPGTTISPFRRHSAV